MKIYSFPAIVDKNSKILILGTMPSKESLRLSQYYGNTRNNFWKILFTLLNEPFLDNYDVKKNLLLNNNIAVWDILKTCERETSADIDIISPVPNDIESLLSEYPNIKVIYLNGRVAEAYYKEFNKTFKIKSFYLPSSSPANAISWEKKLNDWSIILNYLK